MNRRPLSNATYRRLFGAQVVALAGTGLTTVALTLLAYDLAEQNAGAVVGIALALKMVVYVFGAPVITALASRRPRRRVMAALDVLRAGSVVGMLFVTEVWHVYVLIVLVNACSAGYTPTFQATIPDVLADEPTYTRALALSRVAYELEALLSPALAAALLAFVSYDGLFAANAVAFLCSAALVLSTTLPARAPAAESRRCQVMAGTRRYLATRRLRGLLALNLAVAAASAMVIVNTVVYVRDTFGRDAPIVDGFPALLGLWFALGAGLSTVQTPIGRIVTRSGGPEERPALFAAQFSLSHACWLATYPIAGVLGSTIGLAATASILSGIAATAVLLAALAWRADDVTSIQPARVAAQRA